MGNCCGLRRYDNIYYLSGTRRSIASPFIRPLRRYDNTVRRPSWLAIRLWERVMNQSTENSHIFTGVYTKHPEIHSLFTVDNHDESTNREFWHLHLVENIIQHYLSHLQTVETLDMVLALYSLGVYHAQKGVTNSEMMTFQTTSIAFVNQQIVPERARERNRVVEQQVDLIVDVLQGIVNGLNAGIHRYECVMSYIKIVMEKEKSWSKNRKAKRKLGPTTESWEKMAGHLSRL